MQQWNNPTNIISKVATIAFLAALGLFVFQKNTLAQPVLNAKNIAMGGGGTAYLDGFEASFLNPANLAVPVPEGHLHIGLGQLGLIYEPILSSASATDQLTNFANSLYPYVPGNNAISTVQRTALLDENYPGNSSLSQHQTRVDGLVAGFLWQTEETAFSFGIRSRLGSRIETGRGWYSAGFQDNNGHRIRDFTLNQHKQQLYEFSFGFGREFTFINGLIPRLSKLYIGIAPKLVISGLYHNMQYNGRYIETDNGEFIYSSDFNFKATGANTRLVDSYQETSDVRQSIANNLERNFFSQTGGYGFGVDFGLTYVIPLGSNLPAGSSGIQRTEVDKSLRIAFSVTDIGLIRYTDQPLQLSSVQDSLQIAQQDVARSMFTGAGGQYLAYFDEASSLPNPFQNPDNQQRSAFTGLLPTAVNAGMLFELNRLKLMGDLTLGLQNTAFTSTKLAAHLGLEVRPIKNIPLRMGTRLASGTPIGFGLGIGFESRYWDITAGTQFIMRSQTLTSEFAGGAFAGLQLHF